MSNLRLLDETSGTGVSTMTVSDVFSDNFKIYKIALYASSATEQETHIQLVNSNKNFFITNLIYFAIE